MPVPTLERECVNGCGRTVAVEAPEDGRFASILGRLGVLCEACVAAEEAEEREAEERAARELVEARLQGCGLPRLYRGLGWDRVEVDGGRRRAIEAAQRWARGGGRAGLYLHAQVGVGKTWIAAAAANDRIRRGRPLRWASMPVLLARATSDAGRERATAILTGAGTLCLDDVTKVGSSRWAAAQLYAAVDTRLSEGAGLLLTANVPPSGLKRVVGQEFGEALASRVAEGCAVVELEGRDRRLD